MNIVIHSKNIHIMAEPTWTAAQELSQIRAAFSARELVTCSPQIVQCALAFSAHRRAMARFHLKAGYPREKHAIVELDAPNLAPGVRKKLARACERRVETCARSGDMQVLGALLHLKEILGTNKLLVCVDEARRQYKELFAAVPPSSSPSVLAMAVAEASAPSASAEASAASGGGEAKESRGASHSARCVDFQLREKTGLVRLVLESVDRPYGLTLDIKVDDNYPVSAPSIALRKSTFPASVTRIFQAQVEEIARRCALGLTPDQALAGSNGIKRPPASKHGTNNNGGRAAGGRLTVDKLSQLKGDVRVLKKMGELSSRTKLSKNKVNQYTQQGDKRSLKSGRAAARNARRELKGLVKSEAAKEEAWAKEEARLDDIESGALDLNAGDGRCPTRSVGVVIRFVVESFVGRVPHELCQGCGKSAIPMDREAAQGMFKKGSKSRTHRLYCGHWWHNKCLEKVLTKPPFGMQGCPGCAARGMEGVRIWHHDWSRNIKKHEKAWAAKQAREREIQEVADAFGMAFEASGSDSDEADGSDD